MNEGEIKKKLREAFGLGEDGARIETRNACEIRKKLNLDDLDLPDSEVCWTIVCKSSDSEARKVKKFNLDKLNQLQVPIILSNWTFECKIETKEKKFGFTIIFHGCRVHLKNEKKENPESGNKSVNQFSEHFSLQDFKFEKDVIFSAIEFADVFENTQFKNVTFCNGSLWQKHDQQNQKFLKFSFDGISVEKKLVLQDLDFSKGDLDNITEGEFSKLKILKEMHIINCIFQEEVEFNGLTLDILTLSGVEFKEQVSFIGSEIKELAVRIDTKALFDDQCPLKNTIFSKLCLLKSLNIGGVEFGDGTEFGDLSFLNILPIIDSKSQTSEGKEKKSKPIKINFQDVKINGNFNFNNFEVQSENIKIDLLSFEGVEFGGEVSFRSVKVENFRIRFRETSEEFKAGYALPKTITKPSILKDKCRFLEFEITQSANFVGTTFEKDTDFSSVTFPKKEDNKSSSEILSDFSYATFKDDTVFGKHGIETEFYNCSFNGVTFEQKAIFWNVKFVRGEKFRDQYEFIGTSFGEAFFNQISFFREQDGGEKEEAIYFNQCKFKHLSLSQLDLEKVEGLKLLDSELYDFHLDFDSRVKKNIEADFSGTTFYQEFKVDSDVTLLSPKFCSCTFKKPFYFKNFKCEGEVDFSKAVFEDEVIFGVSEAGNEKRD